MIIVILDGKLEGNDKLQLEKCFQWIGYKPLFITNITMNAEEP